MKTKLLPLLWLALCAFAQDPTALDISAALELALANPEFKASLAGRYELADQERALQATLDNPELELNTERINGADTRESLLIVSQRFELFGTRSARVEAAKHLTRVTELQNQDRALAQKALIQERFYKTLYLQERLAVWQAWQQNIQQIESVAAKREQAGEVSGYDRRRLSRELAEARIMMARDSALQSGSWERLRALLALEGPRALSGSLLPNPPSGKAAVDSHPSLLAYDEEIAAAASEARAASHWLLPELTLAAGVKEVQLGAESDRGYYFATRLPLPLFDRKRAALAKANAKAELTRAERSLALAETRGQALASQRELEQSLTAIADYRQQAIDVSKELVHITQTAYREGETDLLELLDAYRSLRDAELNLLAMALDARALAIDFERLGGTL
jgi:outer membrane protein, heavy metal efflux system